MNKPKKPRIVILGGGFGGAYAAKSLSKHMSRGEVEVTLVDRRNYALFYPLLIEAGVGIIEPRHVVVPIRRFARNCNFEMAEVKGIDLTNKTVSICVVGDQRDQDIAYDHLVIGIGSVTRFVDIPGLREHSFEIKSLADAIGMRDRAISLLEHANTLQDSEARKALLTIVVIGSNFTGIEFAGEYQAFLTEAAKDYPNVVPDEIRMIVLERGDRILNSVPEKLAEYARKTLEGRGVKFLYKTTATEIGADYVVLSDGIRLACHTTVWAAGVTANPLLKRIEGLPLNKFGFIECERDLRVKGFDNVWAVGDSATVLTAEGQPYAATAQTASRQGPLVAKNISASLKGEQTATFDFKPLGSFAAIGRRAAAADFKGMHFTGFVGWFLYRSAYLFKMPTFAMKVRLAIDWALEFIFRTDPVALGLHRTKHDENV